MRLLIIAIALSCAHGCLDDNGAASDDMSVAWTDGAANADDVGTLGPDLGVDAASDPGDGGDPPTPDGPVDPPDDAAGLAPDAAAGDPDAAERAPDMADPDPDAAAVDERRFSFFVTSLEAIRALSGSEDGFGGDFGGLEGADDLCRTIAEGVGMGHKTWRAFLSVTEGPDGGPVHAIDRIGDGPWYDANDRLVAQNVEGLMGDRPDGDRQSVLDLPTEHGVPVSSYGDAHDVPTGSNRQGRLASQDRASTCDDWTSADSIGQNQVMCGHSFPRRAATGRGANWVSDHPLRGCTPGVNLLQNGRGNGDCIGCSGGYGALYCFALSP